MAFLQIKKDYHLDKPLIVRLDQEPIDVTGEKNRFDNLEFKILATNLGEDYNAAPYGDKEPFTIRKGDQFDLVMSSALHQKINDYEKGEAVHIELTKQNERLFWKVQVAGDVLIKEHKENPPSKDRSLDIKWGMAFNNATRLACASNINNTTKDKVELIAEIMPRMFQIACTMETALKNTKEEEEDAPF